VNVQVLSVAVIVSLATMTGYASPVDAQAAGGVAGAWKINKELTPMPDGDQPRERPRRPEGGHGGRGGSPMGGFGGGPGSGGPSESELRKMEAVRSRLQEISERLVIAVDGTNVQIVDARGRTANLHADGKSQQRVTGDGEFKSKTRFEGARLIVEEDFGGPKVISTFEPVQANEGRRLQVTVRAEGMRGLPEGGRGGRGGPPGGQPPGQDPRTRSVVRVYDLDGVE
jgi:hypothetical protein